MTREVDAAVVTASQAEHVRMAALVALYFDGGTVRMSSTPFNFTCDADGDAVEETYLGVGNLGSIEAIQEGATLQSYGVKLTLSGVDTSIITAALAEHYQGRDCKIWLILLDADHALVGDPVEVFSGRMDTMEIIRGATAEVTLAVESRLADWDRPRIRRYTDEDQQRVYPGDLGLQFVNEMAEKELRWGL